MYVSEFPLPKRPDQKVLVLEGSPEELPIAALELAQKGGAVDILADGGENIVWVIFEGDPTHLQSFPESSFLGMIARMRQQQVVAAA